MNDLKKNAAQFNLYYQYLVEENAKYNLTSITELEEVYIKHFEDSLSMAKIVDLTLPIKICDVGSGAGFPGIVLALCYPRIELTIIEPTMKRVKFMENLTNLLELKNVRIICGRAEDLARTYENQFDVVTARAVAGLSILLELLVRYVKVGGVMIAYKGDKGIIEVGESGQAIRTLECVLSEVFEYELSLGYGSRTLIKIKKIKKADERYPRKYSEIKKKPL